MTEAETLLREWLEAYNDGTFEPMRVVAEKTETLLAAQAPTIEGIWRSGGQLYRVKPVEP